MKFLQKFVTLYRRTRHPRESARIPIPPMFALFVIATPAVLFLADAPAWLWGIIGIMTLAYGIGRLSVERMILALHRPRLADADYFPELPELAATLAERAGLMTPRVFVIESPVPNAMAGGSQQRGALIAVTTGLLAVLDREELCGVLGHEMAHLRSGSGRPELAKAALQGGVRMIGAMTHHALLFSVGRPESLCRSQIARIFAGCLLSLTQVARSRSQEFRADYEGALLCGDPRWLARALRKLQPFENRCASVRCSPHPPLAERIQKLEASWYGAYL